MDGKLVLAVAAICVLPACRAPRLVAATAGPAARPAAPRGAGMSQAERLAQPLLADESRSRGGPYDRHVSEEAIDAVERAVRLRLEARRPRETACTPVQKAERLKPPTGRGDEYTGAGVDVPRLVDALVKLLGK